MRRRKLLVIGLFAIAFVLSLASSRATAQTFTDLHDFDCSVEGCYPSSPEIMAQGRDGNLYGTTSAGGSNNGYGTVFKATATGAFTTLYTFGPTTGSWPYGGLTLATDGNFYGTAAGKGAYSSGLIFRVTSSGTFTNLHTFTGSDGYNPNSAPVQAGSILYGGTLAATAYKITLTKTFTLLPNRLPGPTAAPLVLGADGYLYGTTINGNVGGSDTVFRLTTAGVVKTIYSFDGTHGGSPSGPLAQGADGNFYGTTMYGGANNYGVAFKVTPSGVLTVLRNFVYSSDGGYPIAGLVVASDGNFYGANSAGGKNGVGTLFRITKTGVFTKLYDFDITHGSYPYGALMQHTNGILYGLTTQGGANSSGVLYSLNVAGLKPFIALTSRSGTPGQTVQILGQGFNSTTSVMFGAGSATFTKVSDTYLTAVIPAAGTTGYVTVKAAAGTLSSIPIFKVKPLISSFTPASGTVGTKVTITGSGFIGATKITFGGVKAISYTVNSGTQITAAVPTGAKTGNIAVTTPGGSASKGTFTVS